MHVFLKKNSVIPDPVVFEHLDLLYLKLIQL